MENIVIAANATLNFARLNTPVNTPYGSRKVFQVQLAYPLDEKEAIEALNSEGARFVEKDGQYVWNTITYFKPRVVEEDGSMMSNERRQSLGNGSLGHIKMQQFIKNRGENAGQPSLSLLAIKVLDYVEYVAPVQMSDEYDF